jgi:hypothetical protein
VCGGRDFDDARMLNRTLDALHLRLCFDTVIQGDAEGADKLAKYWAIYTGVAHDDYSADWERLGKRAGRFRNERMLREGRPGVVIAFPGGAGTRHMMSIAHAAGVNTILVNSAGVLSVRRALQ